MFTLLFSPTYRLSSLQDVLTYYRNDTFLFSERLLRKIISYSAMLINNKTIAMDMCNKYLKRSYRIYSTNKCISSPKLLFIILLID